MEGARNDPPSLILRRRFFSGSSELMSMFTIYCDDIGTDQESRVAAVAGYIGKVAQWEAFQGK
jgi:hypothetical protein